MTPQLFDHVIAHHTNRDTDHTWSSCACGWISEHVRSDLGFVVRTQAREHRRLNTETPVSPSSPMERARCDTGEGQHRHSASPVAVPVLHLDDEDDTDEQIEDAFQQFGFSEEFRSIRDDLRGVS